MTIPTVRFIGPSSVSPGVHWFELLRPLTHDTERMDGVLEVYPTGSTVNLDTLDHLIPERVSAATLVRGQVIESSAAVLPEPVVPVVGEVVPLVNG